MRETPVFISLLHMLNVLYSQWKENCAIHKNNYFTTTTTTVLYINVSVAREISVYTKSFFLSWVVKIWSRGSSIMLCDKYCEKIVKKKRKTYFFHNTIISSLTFIERICFRIVQTNYKKKKCGFSVAESRSTNRKRLLTRFKFSFWLLRKKYWKKWQKTSKHS